MSLIVPPFAFAHCSTNVAATTAPAGTTIISPASPNTESAGDLVLSALAHDCHYLVLAVNDFGSGATDTRTALDILIDPAGGTSWSAWITDLAVGFTVQYVIGEAHVGRTYHFPIYLKAGTSIGARFRGNDVLGTSATVLMMWAFGEPSRPDMWWCGSAVETLGVSGLTSYGVAVSPGASSAWGSWTTIGTSTRDWGAVQFGVNGSDGSQVTGIHHYQFGSGSTAVPGLPTIYASHSSERVITVGLHDHPVWCNAPAGAAWQARITSNVVSPETQYCTVHGVY